MLIGLSFRRSLELKFQSVHLFSLPSMPYYSTAALGKVHVEHPLQQGAMNSRAKKVRRRYQYRYLTKNGHFMT